MAAARRVDPDLVGINWQRFPRVKMHRDIAVE
jgi:hypothetical protein